MTEPQKWIKKGLVFAPDGRFDWLRSHAALPIVDETDQHYRVYFSSRDPQGRAQIGYFEIDLESPERILRLADRPVVAIGSLGAFDDHGVTSSWLVNHAGKKYLYYSGWSRGVTVPFYLSVGLAISEDGGETYQRNSRAPILDRNEIDPYLTASPCVLVEADKWKMWYVSGQRWEMQNGRARHFYNVKYAESSDGVKWKREGIVCIDFASEDEHAIARPCVVRDNGLYRMWYSYRGEAYRIGYAESRDGLVWSRKDRDSGIDVSGSGWDSEMIEYPYVFDHRDRRYMLYNGNGYGESGIGLAVLATGKDD